MNHNIYGKPKPEFYIIYIRLLDSLCLDFIKKAAYIELIILTFYILTPFSVIFFLYRFKPIATELFRSHLTTYNWTNKFLAKWQTLYISLNYNIVIIYPFEGAAV